MNLECPPPQDIIIIGISGDLSQRKLLPALYNLAAADLLPKRGQIIGLARTDLGHEGFIDFARRSIKLFSHTGFDKKVWSLLEPRLTFIRLDNEGYARLREFAKEKERLIYLALPPSVVPEIIRNLQKADLVSGTRLVVEKPFGWDLESAKELARLSHETFDESQIFRIDHYLGKETVQNILVVRFGNSMFERVWNRDAIDHMQITVAESIGIEQRGAFYEEVGALRDIIQNHIFQVLSLLTMEPPASFEPEAIRDERAKLFKAMHPLDPANVVRGQYTRGRVDGHEVPGYREEEGVSPDSTTETFAALKLFIDNWRWAGVPFFLRTGKRLPLRATEVLIAFREVPIRFFEGTGVEELRPNHLTLDIQPEEEIKLSFVAKVPGPEIKVKSVEMRFSYGESFMSKPAEAYERLIHDAMVGNHTLFARRDAVESAWAVMQPVLDNMPPIHFYRAGTWGPQVAESIIAPRQWHLR